MKILLAAALATLIVAPCMAKDDEDKTPSDVQTPGVTEPRVPDTMKSAGASTRSCDPGAGTTSRLRNPE